MVPKIRVISSTLPKVSLAAVAMLSAWKTSPMESARVLTKSSMQQVTAKATTKKNTR